MKKFILLTIAAAAITFNGMAQGNGKGNAKGVGQGRGQSKTKEKGVNVNRNNDVVYENKSKKSTANNSTVGNSKNQPAKVRAAFQSDYPNVGNVVWSKYKGDWTATFDNGISRSTAVYHANGQRKDTRTDITRAQLPGSIWDRIFKRDRVQPVGITQIQSPALGSNIFRVASRSTTGNTQYIYYNTSGQRVQYNY